MSSRNVSLSHHHANNVNVSQITPVKKWSTTPSGQSLRVLHLKNIDKDGNRRWSTSSKSKRWDAVGDWISFSCYGISSSKSCQHIDIKRKSFLLPLYTLTVCVLNHWVDYTIFPHDSPKSQSLTKTSWHCCWVLLINTLLGFKSLCATPFSWRNVSPSNNPFATSRINLS